MKNLIFTIGLLAYALFANAQNTIKFNVKDTKTNENLVGVSIGMIGSSKGTTTDINGNAQITNLSDGLQRFSFSFIGYENLKKEYTLPINESTIEILLESSEEELEEVIVSTTRTSRNIDDTPTRIEAISFEEIDEKSNMRPANVSMLLHESTGIQVQQTSATTANQSIRIQGLDGRYTQLLKDGMPNFGGFANGLSILDIPPLDLKQVEIVKGAASTLYGGGAIAGVVNFITKEPTDKAETTILLNQTNLGGSDFAVYSRAKLSKKFGFTFLGSYNYHKPFDVDKDDFTEIPKTNVLTISPKLFWYFSEKSKLQLSNTATWQNRLGGDVLNIRGENVASHPFFEQNKSFRNTTSLQYDFTTENGNRLTAKQSFNVFSREIALPNYDFGGIQKNAFTDISYLKNSTKHAFISGLNVLIEDFTENKVITQKRDYTQKTLGLYVQDTWNVSQKIIFENGLRSDFVADYGTFLLPRISVLGKWNEKFSTRFGGGLGYKLPTVFTEQTETLAYQNILPVASNLIAEKSIGGTFDFNYKTTIGEHFYLTINQMFFYSEINNSLVLELNNNQFSFKNAQKPIHTQGFESNVRLSYDDLKLFVGYTFTDAKAKYRVDNQTLVLTPRNKVNLALIYEKHQNLKIGLEGYYTDRQWLSDNTQSPTYWEFGFMVEKYFKGFSVYANAENFTDTRQSRFKNVNSGTHTKPVFDEIWTHTEGRSLNMGVKIKF
jgi:outer membrane receptor for ferrienterochelin and colicins